MRTTLRSIVLGAAVVAMPSAGALGQKPGGTLVQITQPEPPNLAPYISTAGPIGQLMASRGHAPSVHFDVAH